MSACQHLGQWGCYNGNGCNFADCPNQNRNPYDVEIDAAERMVESAYLDARSSQAALPRYEAARVRLSHLRYCKMMGLDPEAR